MKKLIFLFVLVTVSSIFADNNRKLISVTGVGISEYKPDVVQISYRVEAEGENISILILDVENRINNFKKLVFKKDINKEKYSDATMSITSRKISPLKNEEKVNSDDIKLTYRVTRNISFELFKISDLEEIVNYAGKLNFLGYNNIKFASSNIKKYEDIAYQNAVKNAKEKATLLVKALGQKLGEVVEIKESSSNGGVVRMYSDNIASSSYSIGLNSVKKNIFIVFEIK